MSIRYIQRLDRVGRCAALILALIVSGCSKEKASPSSQPSVNEQVVQTDGVGETAVSDALGRRPLPIETVELAPAKQDAVWEAERITFQLEQRLGKRWLQHWLARDTADLEQFFSSSLKGTGASDKLESITHGAVTQTRRVADPAIVLSAEEMSEFLCQQVESFTTVEKSSFRVLSIERNLQKSQHWKTRLLVTAAGHTNDGQLVEHLSEHEVEFELSDPENLTAQTITSWDIQFSVHRVAQKPLFREVTKTVGLDEISIEDNWDLNPKDAKQYRFQMAVADYDLDGWLDLALADYDRSRLFRWDSGTGRFESQPGRGIHGVDLNGGTRSNLAGWIDYDNDGYPDLLLGNRLYHNENGVRFQDVTAASGLEFKRQGQGVEVVDFDADGLLDIYIVYQASSDSAPPKSKPRWIDEDDYGESNALWKNLGGGRFRNVTTTTNSGGGLRHSLAGTWFHYDDDHLPDLYIANDLSTNVLLQNRKSGRFRDVSVASKSADFATSMGVAAGDTDNDGNSDLYVANMYSKMGRRIIGQVTESDYPAGVFQQIEGSCAGNRLYRRNETEQPYEEFGEAFGIHGVGWAYAPAMADFDNDGWLDLYATTGFLSFQRGKPDG